MREVQAREPVFGSSEVDLALRERARAAGYAGPEDIIHIFRGLAVSVVRTKCQLVPELIRPKLKLQAVVVGDAGVRAVPEDALVAVDAPDGLRYHGLAGRTWRFTRRNEVRKRRSKTGDFRIRVDGLVEPRAMIADVPRLEDGPAHDFALDSQSPLVRPLRFKVGRNTGFVEGAWVENAGR